MHHILSVFVFTYLHFIHDLLNGVFDRKNLHSIFRRKFCLRRNAQKPQESKEMAAIFYSLSAGLLTIHVRTQFKGSYYRYCYRYRCCRCCYCYCYLSTIKQLDYELEISITHRNTERII